MESIYLTSKDINTNTELYYGYESQIYEFDAFNLMKIFKTNNEQILNNKLNKLNLLSSLPIDFVPIKLVYVDGVFKGYIYKHEKDYQPINCLKQRKAEKYDILCRINEKLKELHKHGVIYGDLHESNILYNGNDIILCDLDNVFINNLNFDEPNTQIKHYIEMVKKIDERLDCYALNLLTVSYYQNIFYPYVFNYLISLYRKQKKFRTEKTNEIIQEMIFLKPDYSGDLLIDNPYKKLTL